MPEHCRLGLLRISTVQLLGNRQVSQIMPPPRPLYRASTDRTSILIKEATERERPFEATFTNKILPPPNNTTMITALHSALATIRHSHLHPIASLSGPRFCAVVPEISLKKLIGTAFQQHNSAAVGSYPGSRHIVHMGVAFVQLLLASIFPYAHASHCREVPLQ